MIITSEKSIDIILSTFPAFAEQWNNHLQYWVLEEERPFGLDVAEFSGFTCEIIINGSDEDVEKIIDVTENLITNGNDEVKRAFKFEFLENITNRMNTMPIERFTKRLKENSKKVCIDIDRLWGTITPGLYQHIYRLIV